MPGIIPNSDKYLAEKLKDYDRRLLNLETQPALNNASIAKGALRILDSAGHALVINGLQPNGEYGTYYYDTFGNLLVAMGQLPDGTHGIQIFDLSGRTLYKVSAEAGQVFPRAALTPIPQVASYLSGQTVNAFRPGTASATMVDLWRVDFSCLGPLVDYDLYVFANAGNMSWRMLCYEAGGPATVVVGPNVETTNVQRLGTFTIPAAGLISGTDPVGRQMTIRIQAQLNSGAVTADIGINGPFSNHN